MNPECVDCLQGRRMAKQVLKANKGLAEAESLLETLNQKITDCTPLQVMMGVRRTLRKERWKFVCDEYLPASREQVMGIAIESRLERCAGPFELEGIGIISAAGGIACGTEVVGIRSKYLQSDLDNDTTTDNPLPIIEDR